MTPQEYLQEISLYIDKNGLIKTNITYQDSGNGLLYSSVDVIIRNLKNIPQSSDYLSSVINCMEYPGLLMRTPTNSFGYEQWDDYLGVTSGCLINKDTNIPKAILGFGILNDFVMDNIQGPTFNFTSFLLRYPHLWGLIIIACCPTLKWVLYPFFLLISKLFSPDASDTSGTQIQWVFIKTLEYVYNTKFTEWNNKFIETYSSNPEYTLFNAYYGPDHPFTKVMK